MESEAVECLVCDDEIQPRERVVVAITGTASTARPWGERTLYDSRNGITCIEDEKERLVHVDCLIGGDSSGD